eukprot:Nitzschia sp. Nitz4//scaffold63_size106090//64408//66450//NITZ4_004396-RA/size106090-processed-gene-0.146-mRNA-1//-1//CDS//3329555993//8820//frame0
MSSRKHGKPSAVMEVSMDGVFGTSFVCDDASVLPSMQASLPQSQNESLSDSSESQQPQYRVVPRGSLKPKDRRAGPRSKKRRVGDGTHSLEDSDQEGPFLPEDRISPRLMEIPIQSVTLGEPSLSKNAFLSTWLDFIIPRGRISDAYFDPDECPKCLRVNVDLGKKECLAALQTSFPYQGRYYQLVSLKTQSDSGGGGGRSSISARFGKKKTAVLYYVTTSGPDVMELDLQTELEKIADFRSQPPYKVSSRLELFLTPSREGCHWRTDLMADDFEIVPEDSHIGCGFIPEEFLYSLFPNAHTAQAIDSMQVRIFAPKIGIAKGMLVKKRGITRIQLPPSMIKVGASRINQSASWAVMIAKNVFPSISIETFGRFLDPDEKDPSEGQLRSIKKDLSEMYANIFTGLNVPPVLVETYKREIRSIENIRHANVLGVRDPTGQLPENTIFITGYTSDRNGNRVHMSELYPEIFISRSPCLEPTDAKLLKVVNHKPYEMSTETWEWLRSMKFGHVLFSVPRDRENAVPLPEACGNGDLDGDLYFICFHDKILSCLRRTFRHPRMIEDIAIQEEEIRQKRVNSQSLPRVCEGSPTWLEEAQKDMLDLANRNLVGRLTGTLYTASNKVALDAKEGIWDEDARALAKAYKSTLEYLKHRTKVELPARLKGRIDKSLHDYIAWTTTYSR